MVVMKLKKRGSDGKGSTTCLSFNHPLSLSPGPHDVTWRHSERHTTTVPYDNDWASPYSDSTARVYPLQVPRQSHLVVNGCTTLGDPSSRRTNRMYLTHIPGWHVAKPTVAKSRPEVR